ncbi:MAG: PD40 domain-containing protein [Chloroflexi bacterium]|nr:PD40 domain-containing protein [Chloroflexota bacterium]
MQHVPRFYRVLISMGVFILIFNLLNPLTSQAQTPSDLTIESNDSRVAQGGTWSSQNATQASGGSYLLSSGAQADTLTLSFRGPSVEVVYVKGPKLNPIVLEVDGTVLQTVSATADQPTYEQVVALNNLANAAHILKVYGQGSGAIALDAFRFPASTQNTLVGQGGGTRAVSCTPLSLIHRVSLSSSGQAGNFNSMDSSLSADGSYVAFSSDATNLVLGDTNNVADVFVYDQHTCIISRVSVTSDGQPSVGGNSLTPVISGDGRYVAFQSYATNLVTGDNNNNADIFVHDRQTGQTTRVSVATNGAQATGGHSYNPAISADGRSIVFESFATNLVTSDGNNQSDIFIRNTLANTTTRISLTNSGLEGNGGSSNPAISPDARYVTFDSFATNLVAGDTNGFSDIFVRDRQTNTTTRVSLSGVAGQDGASSDPVISADGRYIAFESGAANLVTGDTNGNYDVFVRDRQTNLTMRVSVSSTGTQAGSSSFNPAISANGRYITFESTATNLVSGDSNFLSDVFLHDLQSSTTTLVSFPYNGGQAVGGGSFNPAISSDGRYVTFNSSANNLVGGDTNGFLDVFVTPHPQPSPDTLALFNTGLNQVNLLDTLQDNPPQSAYTLFSAYAPVNGGQWVMGDWNGDGLKTPGVYTNGPFFYTNKAGEAQANDWHSLWIGVSGPPVAGRFNINLPNDCIGAVQSANFPPYGVAFVLYFTCDLSGNTTPTIAFQWLSVLLPDSGGFSGPHQFAAGDFDGDGDDSIAVRRGTYVAFGTVAPSESAASFPYAQYIGAPATSDGEIFVVGDWNGDHLDSFGLFYQSGELFYRNDLQFNSGVYGNQSIVRPFATPIQATSWH